MTKGNGGGKGGHKRTGVIQKVGTKIKIQSPSSHPHSRNQLTSYAKGVAAEG
jgi:hypothetical protein